MLTADDWGIVRLTLVVATRSTVCGLPLALLLALLLSRGRFAGRAVLDALVHLPIVLPPVVIGWMLLMLLGVRGPIGAMLLAQFGIRLVFTTWGAAIACIAMTLPLMVRPIRQALDAGEAALEQAARTLGAGPLDRLLTITLPLAAPGILSAALIGFAACLGEFGAVITFAANIPGQTQTLPLAIYSALQSADGDATAARLSIISVVLALVLLLAADAGGRWLDRRIGR